MAHLPLGDIGFHPEPSPPTGGRYQTNVFGYCPMYLDIIRKLEPDAAPLLPFDMRNDPPARLDLSVANVRETGPDIYLPEKLQAYLAQVRRLRDTTLLWGGYLEHRLIYGTPLFHQDAEARCIHLGLDFWAPAGTTVFAPLPGIIHSFQDNANRGDYGPTIILMHEVLGLRFHSLYGHLSRMALDRISIGQYIAKGEALATFGTEEENGNWPPHLHFQLIIDMEGKSGDYPGVCKITDLEYYAANCPNPRFLLAL